MEENPIYIGKTSWKRLMLFPSAFLIFYFVYTCLLRAMPFDLQTGLIILFVGGFTLVLTLPGKVILYDTYMLIQYPIDLFDRNTKRDYTSIDTIKLRNGYKYGDNLILIGKLKWEKLYYVLMSRKEYQNMVDVLRSKGLYVDVRMRKVN